MIMNQLRLYASLNRTGNSLSDKSAISSLNSATERPILRAMRHPIRSAVTLALLGAIACDPSPTPVLGVSTSAPFVDAATLAIADARAEGFDAALDTMIVPEATNLAAPALEASQRFVAVPGIAAVIGHSNSAASLAASQVYNAHEVLQLSPTASAVVYSEAGPFSFRLVPPDDRQGRFLAGVLRDSLPPGTALAVAYVNDDYGRGLRASFQEATEALGATADIRLFVPYVEQPGVDTAAEAHVVDAVVSARPGAIVWLGRPTTLTRVLPALRSRLGAIPIYGSDAVANAVQLDEGDGRWDGVRFVDFVDMDGNPTVRDFARRYRERFGGREASGSDALTYDAMRLLLTAIADGATTGPEIRAYLLSLGRQRPIYQGITGPIRFDEQGDVDRSYHLGGIGIR